VHIVFASLDKQTNYVLYVLNIYRFRIFTFFPYTSIEGVHSHFDVWGNLLFNQLATLNNLEVCFQSIRYVGCLF